MKKNKYLYLIIIVLFIVLFYTHSNTFLANDDLPYMFLYRTSTRVSSIIDVLKNQYVDYFVINGRVFVHTILQSVLIFDKKLWMVLNPIMIITSLLFVIKLVETKNKQINKSLSLLLGMSLFLLLIPFKNIIYWVAGSINYIWVFVFLTLLLYLYYKYGFCKNKYINTIIIFILCMIHECTMVFTIVFVLGNMILEWYKLKRFNKDYILYMLGFLGSLVLLLSPANQYRLVSDEAWNSLSLIEKLTTSIPVISKGILNVTSYKTLLSYVFIISIVYLLVKNRDKFSKINIVLIVINILLIYIFNNDWLYFILVILLFVGEIYTYIKNKQYESIILSLSIYAIVYFNIISPTYAAGRPNYYFFMYIIFIAITLFNSDILKYKISRKISYIFVPLISIILLINEVCVYRNIGLYHQKRIDEINEYLELDNNDILYLTRIPDKYNDYHMDINLPDKNWFNYQSFIYYYNLPEDIEIVYLDKNN